MIFQYPGGVPRYHVAGGFIYEIGTAEPVFYIAPDETRMSDGLVCRCSDGAAVFWISDNYLHQSGQPPTLYFGEE